MPGLSANGLLSDVTWSGDGGGVTGISGGIAGGMLFSSIT